MKTALLIIDVQNSFLAALNGVFSKVIKKDEVESLLK